MSPSAEVIDFPRTEDVYGRFTSLLALAHERFGGELGGRLVLLAPLNEAAAATSLAANIAGAALLGVDPHGERLKWGIRNGVCDFLVNHLDEALRILKNEVRKKQPASVWLQAEPGLALQEMVARGLQPDVYAWFEVDESELLTELGARSAVPLADSPELLPCEVSWSVATAKTLWMPKIDGLATRVFDSPTDDRRRWLQFAPRYLGRAFLARRYMRLTRDEADRFTDLLREEVQSGEIQVPVKLMIESSGRVELVEFVRGA